MNQLYQDAMATVREYGPPDLFITVTVNPTWPEIIEVIGKNENVMDHPTVVARVFNLKIKALMKRLIKMKRLGVVVAYVSTIEFQKRGTPHLHLMLTLSKECTPDTPEKINALVTAEIPCPKKEPKLYDIVTRCMLHGPCEGRPCSAKGHCRFRFPKPFQEETTIVEGAYPAYQRRKNGHTFWKGKTEFTNADVVPHNKYLSLFLNCHVNVEVAVGIQAVKYLYKYICKGHDRASLEVKQNDETKAFVDARYIGAPEARLPAVQRLILHDPKRGLLLAKLVKPEATTEQKAKASRTTLNQFSQLNIDGTQGLFKNARDCYYHEIPNHFAWDKTVNKWVPRTKVLTTVGRIYFASLHQGKRYYIRLLLLHRKDVRSFKDLRTVGGMIMPDFRAAADELGLLLNNKQYDQALAEGAAFKTGFQLHLMFCIILVHSPPAAPPKLFEDHWRNLGDDVGYLLAENHNLRGASDDQQRAFTLYLVDQVL
ncbi:hypothetical protein MJO29_004103 [Puccinia striiformis f. sp. tritici]|nr:hypothetical protein MJO29_004103 [Puccinia striiformis f. sp. tritici]